MTCSSSSSSSSSQSTCCETLEKYVYEEKWFSVDCGSLLSEGETIEESSPAPVVTSTKLNGATSDLVITEEVVVGEEIRFFISGGTQGTRYKITIQFETSLDQKHQGVVLLKVL